MKIRVLPQRIMGHMASKLLPHGSLMRSLVVRLAGWHQGSPSTFRPGSYGRGLLMALATMAVVLGGCGPSRTSSPQVPPVALLPPPALTPGPDYRVQLGDTLKVAFLFQPENDIDLVVRPDGRISLAAAGEIEAVGKTEQELEESIRKRASAHLRDPKVTVTVTKIGTQNVYVGGEVLHPGVVSLVPGMTPLQAPSWRGSARPPWQRLHPLPPGSFVG